MKIRIAEPKDLNEIRELFHICFGDPYEYVDFYLNNKFSSVHCVVLEDSEEIIGMVHLLPCKIFPNEKAFYWYAACIRPDRQGQGLFRALTKSIRDYTYQKGFKNLCVPAKGLENFYRSIGFTSEYTTSDITYYPNQSNDQFHIEQANLKDFLQIRHTKGDSRWDEASIRYAMTENEYCGGKNLKVEIDHQTYCFFAIQKENSFLIDYHNMPKEIFEKFKNSLFNLLDCQELIFRTVGNKKLIGLSDSNLLTEHSKITMTLA